MKTASRKPRTGHGCPSARLALLAVAALAAACGPAEPTPGIDVGTITVLTHTPPSPPGSTSESSEECNNDYFPADEGSTWVYASDAGGTNAQSSSTIVSGGDDGFTVQITMASGATFVVEWSCSDGDLTQLTPTATLFAQGGSGTVTTTSHSGVTIPADLEARPSWQESGEWSADVGGTAFEGSYASDSTAAGTEFVTVPFGTFEAVHVDSHQEGTLNGDPLAPCEITQWWAKDVGLIKQETTCTTGGQGMTEVVELVDFTSPN